MKSILTTAFLVPLLVAVLCAAADETNDATPAITNVRGTQFPRISADLRVTFRVKAPNAQKVEFDTGKRYAATKSEDNWYHIFVMFYLIVMQLFYLGAMLWFLKRRKRGTDTTATSTISESAQGTPK